MLSQKRMVAPLYHYTGQVAPWFGKSGSLEECKCCHASWLRLISTSDCFIQYKVFELLVCYLKGIWLHTYTVTLSEPQIWEVRVTCGVKMMPYHHNWGWYPRTFDCNCFMQVPMHLFNTKMYFLTMSKYGIPTGLSSLSRPNISTGKINCFYRYIILY